MELCVDPHLNLCGKGVSRLSADIVGYLRVVRFPLTEHPGIVVRISL